MGSAALQGRLWGSAAADWAQFVEPLMRPVYDAVFDVVGVALGTRLLDAGCGSGLALQMAAARGAAVSGLDASAALVAVAAQRVPGADLRVADLEEPGLAAGSFDVVTAFNSVQYAADPVNALRALRRLAVPGAPVALVTWAEPDRCETRTVLAAIGALLPPPPGTGGPFALSAPGKLEDLLRAGGLAPVSTGEVPTPFGFDDLDTAVRAQMASGPAARAVEQVGRAAVTDAIRSAMVGSRRSDGSYRHDNAFRYVVATA